jgi:starch synthase
MDYTNLMKLAIDYSDGVIQGSPKIDQKLKNYIIDNKKEFLIPSTNFQESVAEIDAFYDKIDS